MSERYRGQWIDPRIYELNDRSGWTAEVYVAEDVDDETIDTQFLVNGIFPTLEKAMAAALACGKLEIDKRIRSKDIASVIEDATLLPSTYRRGFSSGSRTDDVAKGYDGQPARVDRPDNPEDRFLKK